MKIFVLFFVLATAIFLTVDGQDVDTCTEENCVLPDCRCATTRIPEAIDRKDTPQFVVISFEGPIHVYSTLVDLVTFQRNRLNPDKCPVLINILLETQLTNMQLLKELEASRYEINIQQRNKIPNGQNNFLTDFNEQRGLIQNNGEWEGDITGTAHRIKNLSSSIDDYFSSLLTGKYEYDFSEKPLPCVTEGTWPFTLDYNSFRSCPEWPVKRSHKGLWTIPSLTWTHPVVNRSCQVIDDCYWLSDDEAVRYWMIKEFYQHTAKSKSPFVFRIHNSIFLSMPKYVQIVTGFLDFLQTMPDVFIVSPSSLVRWMKNPRDITDMINNQIC